MQPLRGRVIAQVSNTPFVEILQNLPYYQDHEITHIQISPVQAHCTHIGPWYRVYQPCGLTISNSLGTKEDLIDLVDAAKKYRIGIIVDVVFHHKTGCPLCNPAAVFFWGARLQSWLFTVVEALRWKEKTETNFSRFGINEWGPPLDWNDQATFDSGVNFLSELLQIGVSGFRFDAAKHMHPRPLAKVLEQSIKKSGITNPSELLNYAEVLDHQSSICEEYIFNNDGHCLLTTSNYPLTFAVQSALKPWGDLRTCVDYQSWFTFQAVSLADSHDSQEGDSYKFHDERESALAISILLAMGAGIPLIYHTFLEDQLVKSAIRFFHETQYQSSSYHPHSNSQLLIIQRGKGIAIVNKKNEFVEWSHLEVNLVEGFYRELQYNFTIKVSNNGQSNFVSEWGLGEPGGMKIGPRDVLFFLPK